MADIKGAVALFQRLDNYEMTHPEASDKVVGASFNGRQLKGIVSGDNVRSIKLFNNELKKHTAGVDSKGVTLRNAKKALIGEVVTYFKGSFPDRPESNIQSRVETVLRQNPGSDPGHILTTIMEGMSQPLMDPVAQGKGHAMPEFMPEPEPVDIGAVTEKLHLPLHETGDRQEQVSAAEFRSVAAGGSAEQQEVHAEFQAECERLRALEEFKSTTALLSAIDFKSLETVSDFEKKVSQETDPAQKALYQKQLDAALLKLEPSLENIAQLRKAYFQLESTLGRRWSADIFVTEANLPADLKAVYQAGQRCEQHRTESVHLAQLGQMKKDHDSVLHHPRVVVEGGGPVGLLSALKQYEAGADVTLFEKRSMEYDRSQILRLDNQWVKELRYYLGSQFDHTFLSGEQGSIKSDGSIHIRTAELEHALHGRLSELISFVDTGRTKPDIKRLAAHSIVDVSPPAEAGKRFVVNARYDQSRDSQYDAGKSKSAPFQGLDKVEADIIICAGGKNSSTREQFFNYAPVTKSKAFGVASWENPSLDNREQDLLKKVPGVFTITPEFKGKCVEHARKEFQSLEDEFGAPALPGFYQNLVADMNRELTKTNGDLATRHFENYQKAYIGMELPDNFNIWLHQYDRDIDAALGGQLNKSQRARVKSVARQAWFQSVADVGQKDQPSLSDKFKLDLSMMDPKFTANFRTSLDQNTESAVVVGASGDKHKLVVFPAGDSATGPHFMTATGLTGGREDTGNQADFTRKLAMLEDPLNPDEVAPLMASVKSRMKNTSDFVIERGLGTSSAFPDDITPESLAAFQRRPAADISKNLEGLVILHLRDAVADDPWPGLKITPGAQNNVFNADMNGKKFTLTVTKNGLIEAEDQAFPGVKESFDTLGIFRLTHVRG